MNDLRYLHVARADMMRGSHEHAHDTHATPTVLVIGTLDTKGPETLY